MIGKSQGWASFVRCFLHVFVGLTALIYVFLLVVDPFDSGYLPTLMPAGIQDNSARTANISRGRDPRFSAAIIGNSRVQPLAPARLNAELPFSFVQLSVTGSGPLEQVRMIEWFVSHHAHVDALIIGIDGNVCAPGDEIAQIHPFPYRLYDGVGSYLKVLYSTRAIDFAWRRLRLAAGWLTPTDPTGYNDYEAGRVWNYAPKISPEALAAPADLSVRETADIKLPGLALITATIDRVAPAAPVIFVIPPMHVPSLPPGDSLFSRAQGACKSRLLTYVSTRRNAVVLDYLLDNAATRDPSNFMDSDHMRKSLALPIEQDIIAWLRTPAAGRR